MSGTGTGTGTVDASEVIELEAMRIEVVRDGGADRVVAYDARELFDAANEALIEGRYQEAIDRYEDMIGDFSESSLVVPALYNAGLAHEGLGQWALALGRYREIGRRAESGRDSIDAQVRLAAVLAELERWEEAIEALEALLARDDLSASDRIEGLARLGYVLLEAKDLPGAEEVLRQALAYYEEVTETDALDTDYFVAMAAYYLAQIPHREFLDIPLRLPDRQIALDMEAKADRLLIAHDRYLRAVEIGNPFWATAAGYQIATMQKQFWDALVTAPIPPFPAIDAAYQDVAAEEYVRQVHAKTRTFLEKALRTHRKNIAWADSKGFATPWVEGSRAQVRLIADILARESSGELVVPTEAEQTGPGLDLGPEAGRDPTGPGYVPGRVDL